jgi:tellurite resistance protein TerC
VIYYLFFTLFVLAMLVLDLVVINKKDHAPSFKEALTWSAVWVALALLFNLLLYRWKGSTAAFEFLAGYLIEESLSVDNLFIFLLIFKYFNVPSLYLHRVLFWGILGAIILRAIFIGAGIALVTRFHWVIYLFGAFLVVTGVKMAFQQDKELHPESNPVLRLFRAFFRVSAQYDGGRFFTKRDGRFLATPLFVVLLFVETTDVIFAVDSIPAVFAVTLDPFIVYTSNIFAILGLRSLFFVLSGMMEKFRYLQYGLSAILSFVGTKMLISGFYHIPIEVALGVLALILMISVLASLIPDSKKEAPDS